MTEIWMATFNKGKVREYNMLLEGLNLDVHGANELPTYAAPEETGDTFVENAQIKAKSLAAIKPGVWVFSEDSGLEVDGLNGMPGVHSARYAGKNASDAENRAKLLKMVQIRTPQNRLARFKAVIVLLSPEGEQFAFEGTMEGSVAQKETGSEGFGYDSVFIPEGEEKTNAELGLKFKNERSHRFEAGKKMLELLRERIRL